jgi:hypothetical protein
VAAGSRSWGGNLALYDMKGDYIIIRNEFIVQNEIIIKRNALYEMRKCLPIAQLSPSLIYFVLPSSLNRVTLHVSIPFTHCPTCPPSHLRQSCLGVVRLSSRHNFFYLSLS